MMPKCEHGSWGRSFELVRWYRVRASVPWLHSPRQQGLSRDMHTYPVTVIVMSSQVIEPVGTAPARRLSVARGPMSNLALLPDIAGYCADCLSVPMSATRPWPTLSRHQRPFERIWLVQVLRSKASSVCRRYWQLNRLHLPIWGGTMRVYQVCHFPCRCCKSLIVAYYLMHIHGKWRRVPVMGADQPSKKRFDRFRRQPSASDTCRGAWTTQVHSLRRVIVTLQANPSV